MVMTDVNLQETSPMTAIVLVVSTSRRSMYTHHRTEKSIEHNIAGWFLGQAVMPPPLTSHLSISPHKQSAAWLSLPRWYCQLKSKSCNPRDHRVNLALFGAHFPEIHERIVIRKNNHLGCKNKSAKFSQGISNHILFPWCTKPSVLVLT